MDAPPEPRRTFSIADLLLLMLGFSMGFALLAKLRSNGGFSDPQPLALLLVGIAIGFAITFPLLRLRDCRINSNRRRFLISDACEGWPMLNLGLGALFLPFGNAPFAAEVLPMIFFPLSILIQICLAVLSVPVAMVLSAESDRNWLDLFGCATGALNGSVLLLLILSVIWEL
jgi:hypothetical protein